MFLFFGLLLLRIRWIGRYLLDFHLDYFGCLTLKDRGVFSNIRGKSVLAIQLTNEWAGITLSVDLIAVDSQIHFGEFALRAADIFLNEFIQPLPQIFLCKLSVDNVVGVVFAPSLFEGCLRCLLKAKPL
jgi:hypothetical protein